MSEPCTRGKQGEEGHTGVEGVRGGVLAEGRAWLAGQSALLRTQRCICTALQHVPKITVSMVH